MSETFIHFI